MAKEKEIKKTEEVQKPAQTQEVYMSMDSFIEENQSTKPKDSNIGPGFKAWFLRIKKGNPHARLSKSQWEGQLKKFLTEEVK